MQLTYQCVEPLLGADIPTIRRRPNLLQLWCRRLACTHTGRRDACTTCPQFLAPAGATRRSVFPARHVRSRNRSFPHVFPKNSKIFDCREALLTLADFVCGPAAPSRNRSFSPRFHKEVQNLVFSARHCGDHASQLRSASCAPRRCTETGHFSHVFTKNFKIS